MTSIIRIGIVVFIAILLGFCAASGTFAVTLEYGSWEACIKAGNRAQSEAYQDPVVVGIERKFSEKEFIEVSFARRVTSKGYTRGSDFQYSFIYRYKFGLQNIYHKLIAKNGNNIYYILGNNPYLGIDLGFININSQPFSATIYLTYDFGLLDNLRWIEQRPGYDYANKETGTYHTSLVVMRLEHKVLPDLFLILQGELGESVYSGTFTNYDISDDTNRGSIHINENKGLLGVEYHFADNYSFSMLSNLSDSTNRIWLNVDYNLYL